MRRLKSLLWGHHLISENQTQLAPPSISLDEAVVHCTSA